MVRDLAATFVDDFLIPLEPALLEREANGEKPFGVRFHRSAGAVHNHGLLAVRVRIPYYLLAMFYALTDGSTLYYVFYATISIVASSYFYPLYVGSRGCEALRSFGFG